MDHERHLAWLAIGIGEWSTALAHLDALSAGHHHVPPTTRGQVERELNLLCMRWNHATGTLTYSNEERERVSANARTWAAEHVSLIDDLMKEGSEA